MSYDTIDPLELTVRRAEAAEFAADHNAAKQAKRCQCPSPVTYYEADGEKRCMCGREARS